MAKTVDNEITMTEAENTEAKKDVFRMNEKDILSALLAAGSYKQSEEDTATIEIIRNKTVLFTFRIRPLGESEYLKCRKNNTTYKRNKSVGTRVAESVDAARYRAQLIYEATIPEDREKIWNNHEAWEAFSVLNGIDLIEFVLMAGEKDRIIDKIDEISGYTMTEEETAKN